jgi:hypothetical protein
MARCSLYALRFAQRMESYYHAPVSAARAHHTALRGLSSLNLRRALRLAEQPVELAAARLRRVEACS